MVWQCLNRESTILSIISKVRSLSASRMRNSVRQQKYFLIPLDEQELLFFFSKTTGRHVAGATLRRGFTRL